MPRFYKKKWYGCFEIIKKDFYKKKIKMIDTEDIYYGGRYFDCLSCQQLK